MRAVVYLLEFAAVVGIAWLGVRALWRALSSRVERRRLERAPWALEESARKGLVYLEAVKPGCEPQLLAGPVALAAEDFEIDIEVKRNDAYEALTALNNKRR